MHVPIRPQECAHTCTRAFSACCWGLWARIHHDIFTRARAHTQRERERETHSHTHTHWRDRRAIYRGEVTESRPTTRMLDPGGKGPSNLKSTTYCETAPAKGELATTSHVTARVLVVRATAPLMTPNTDSPSLHPSTTQSMTTKGIVKFSAQSIATFSAVTFSAVTFSAARLVQFSGKGSDADTDTFLPFEGLTRVWKHDVSCRQQCIQLPVGAVTEKGIGRPTLRQSCCVTWED